MRILQNFWIGWISICRSINDRIERFFEHHTRFVTKHHKSTIAVCLLFVIVMGIGGIRFKSLERNEELFIPQESRAFRDLETADKYFPEKYRANDVIVSFTNASKNVFDSNEIFLELLQLHKKIENISDFNNVCLKSPLTKSCLFVSPLDVFGFDSDRVRQANTSVKISSKFNERLLNWNLLFSNGRHAALVYPVLFGNYQGNSDQVVSATAIRITYYMRFLTTLETGYHKQIEWEEKFIDLCSSQQKAFDAAGFRLEYYAARTPDDAVLESTVGDLPLFSVAFILMVLFCLLVFSKIKNPVTGHVTVGIMGICVIMLGVGTGFGLAMWCGTDFVAFTGILMFLILGVGMDNMFIIVDAVEMVDADVQGPERIVKAMKHVGGSITMTTSTDLVAFAVSTVTDFPAVKLFCIYASLSIVFAYLGLVTLFLALMTWDIERIESGKRDLLPCCKAKNVPENPWAPEDMPISRKILHKWGCFIMTLPMKIIIFLMACGLLAAGVYGTTMVPRHFSWKKVSTDGSYFRSYAEVKENMFPHGYAVSVVTPEGLDYTLNSTQNALIEIDVIARANPRFEDNTLNWMTMYRNWALTQNITDLTGANFYKHLTAFRRTFTFINADLVMHSDDYIFASRVIIFYENVLDAVNQANAMSAIRDDLEEKAGIKDLVPITLNYIYNEQTLKVQDATIRNIAISGAAIVVMTLPYLMHPGITGLVFLSFTSLIFELLGLMAAWDVSLDAIAMIIVIMAIGFSVDYTCHVAHSYMISTKSTPNERAIYALETMGGSVLNGGISTFLGMLITAFSQAEGFRIFFKMVFGIVVLGLLHGLLFLPVLLTIFVRRDLRADMKLFIERTEEQQRRVSKMLTQERRRESISYRVSTEQNHGDDNVNVITINGDVPYVNNTYEGDDFRITNTFSRTNNTFVEPKAHCINTLPTVEETK